MAINPLQKYFRQPKIFINLPSHGIYCEKDTLHGDPANIPVYGMTGMDEIISKTPDALLSGESSVKIIESCCPSIKNAWGLSVLDTDVVFAAIRIATYGNLLAVDHICSNCQTDNTYDLDLNRVIDHFSTCKYDNTIVYKDLIIKTKPLNYKQATEFNLQNFTLQQKLTQIQTMEESSEKQYAINSLWQELATSQKFAFAASVDAVETPTGVVNERGFISEWLENSEKDLLDLIKLHIEKNKEVWSMPKFPVKCSNCGHEDSLALNLDQSNFFA